MSPCYRYSKIEQPVAPWESIEDTPESRAAAIKKGAMFITEPSLSAPYTDNGQEPYRYGDCYQDFDGANLALVVADVLRFIAHLETVFAIDPYSLDYWLSGKKGIHVRIPATLFGIKSVGDPLLPLIFKRIAATWVAQLELSTLDMSIYCMKRGKMLRVENVKRENGRYKVPISYDELTLPVDELVELTQSPRLDFEREPEPTEENGLLSEFYKRLAQAVYSEIQTRPAPPSAEQCELLSRAIPQCIRAIIETRPAKSDSVNFNKLVLNLVTYFRDAGFDGATALEAVQSFLDGYAHSATYDTPGKRRTHFLTMWNYLQGNDSYRFGCSYVKGLKLPGNLFECRLCPVNSGREPVKDVFGQDITREEILDAASRSQQGAAELFRRLYQGTYLYDHAAKSWHEWNGNQWTFERIGEPLAKLDEVAELFANAAASFKAEASTSSHAASCTTDSAVKSVHDAKSKALKTQPSMCRKLASSLRFLQFRKQVIEFAAQGVESLGYGGQGWDHAPGLLPVANGIVDLATGELRPGRQEDFIKTATPVAYDPTAQAPTWSQFMLEIMGGDLGLVGYLRRLFGYAAIGSVREHVLPILYGQGRNGKGTMIETIKSVLGDMAAPVRSEMLLDQTYFRSSASPSPDIMALRGRRLAWASETNTGRNFDTSKVKFLVGGDTLVGRAVYGKHEVFFRPTHTLMLLTNNKPSANPDDFALWERISLIPFEFSFVDNPTMPNERKRDPQLPEKLKAEAQGILAWIVQGAQEYLREGLNPPELVLAATEEYRSGHDHLQAFLDEKCFVSPHVKVKAGVFYNAYRQWAERRSLKPVNGEKFGLRMKAKFGHEHLKSGNVYIGVELQNSSE